jgi:hypothetical protein
MVQSASWMACRICWTESLPTGSPTPAAPSWSGPASNCRAIHFKGPLALVQLLNTSTNPGFSRLRSVACCRDG